jgi:hypothetical protein
MARVVTKTSNPMVKQCLVNKIQGFWLLLNALQIDVDCKLAMQSLLQCGNYDSKLEICIIEWL